MTKGKYFDLMDAKPHIDIPTLNYVWDWIWRMNAVKKPKNVKERARQWEREEILQLLQDMAGWEINAQTDGANSPSNAGAGIGYGQNPVMVKEEFAMDRLVCKCCGETFDECDGTFYPDGVFRCYDCTGYRTHDDGNCPNCGGDFCECECRDEEE